MNHPKPEDWVPYLYGELKPDERRRLKTHMQGCPDCRGEIAHWQRTAHRLDAWKLPGRRPTLGWLAPGLKWAAAALVVLGVGFGLGRFAGTAAVAGRVRAQLEPQVRRELQQQMAQLVREELARSTASQPKDSSDQTDRLLAACTLNEARIEALENSCLSLKRQLDTVAINTQQGFVQLATYRPTAAPPQ